MSRYSRTILVVLLCLAGSAMADAASQAYSRSLQFSADRLLISPQAPWRAARLLAISEALHELDPDNFDSLRLWADLCQTRQDYPQAAAAEAKLFAARPYCHATFTRWVNYSLQTLQTADDRAGFLNKIITDTKRYAPAMRADVAVLSAEIDLRRGSKALALKTLEAALAHSPYHQGALLMRLKLTDAPSLKLRMETMIALLRHNPRGWWVLRSLAAEAAKAGLYKPATEFYGHAWNIHTPRASLEIAPPEFVNDYISTMLDAGNAVGVGNRFAVSLSRNSNNSAFMSLLLEAFHAIGDNPRHQSTRRRLYQIYHTRLSTAGAMSKEKPKSDLARVARINALIEMSWFCLLADGKGLESLKYSRRAQLLGAEGDEITLLVGCGELKASNIAGLAKLLPLTKKYAMACAYIAEYDFTKRDGKLARKVLADGFTLSRTGRAWRKLSLLARQQKIPIPPAKDAALVKRLLDTLDPRVVQLGLRPEKFIDVTLKLTNANVSLGDPIVCTATLSNRSELPISIGPDGLIDTRIALRVSLEGTLRKVFRDVPMGILHAPFYLKPGYSISTVVRLDAGSVYPYLVANPLRASSLLVQSLLSPKTTRRGVVSGLPTIFPAELRCNRFGILPNPENKIDFISPNSYAKGILRLATLLRSTKLADRLLATRRIGSMLSWLRAVETKKQTLPVTLKTVAKKEPLLALATQALRDPSAIVRTEMLTALQDVPADSGILNLAGLVFEDPSPWVRFRAAELLGISALPGSDQMLAMFTKDKDKHVKKLATLLLQQKKNAAKIKAVAKAKSDAAKAARAKEAADAAAKLPKLAPLPPKLKPVEKPAPASAPK